MAHTPPSRLDSIDALRGVAMLWMTGFHFCFDLSYFGIWPQNFWGDPFWTVQRTCIVTLFLFCAGLGQAVALAQPPRPSQRPTRWLRRWFQIAGAALAVSVASWVVFPHSFIYFGVLHGMAVMLLLVRCIAHWGRWLWLVGVIALVLPSLMALWLNDAAADIAPYFNARTLNWLGLITHKPHTQDYVPLFPWLAVMCWGVASGQWLMPYLAYPVPQYARWLALLGRWSLSYYLLHQIVMLGALGGIVWALNVSRALPP